MAIFRKIHTSFWSDTFIQDLDNDHKLFYLYLLTNEKTKQCGIYEISKKQISFELGYSIDRVSKLLKHFIDSGRIMYNDATKEIALKNWNKFNGSTSPKVVRCIQSELSNVKDIVLIEYVNGMYTASQEEQEQEEEQEGVSNETKVDKIDFDALLVFFNQTLGKKITTFGDAKAKINKRLKEGFKKEDFKHTILNIKEDLFAKENNYKYVTLEYISRVKTLQMFSHVPKVNNSNVYSPQQDLN